MFTADHDLVFAHPPIGTVLDASKLRRRFKTALDAAGVRPLASTTYATPTALRWPRGRTLRMLQEWIGHRDYKTTEIYADYSADVTRGAAFAQRAFGRTEQRDEAGPHPRARGWSRPT
jgi:integrase